MLTRNSQISPSLTTTLCSCTQALLTLSRVLLARFTPVAMAALTTALGMLPLLQDAFFIAMAVTIIFGLMIATMLTMVFVPVLYAILFRVESPY